MVTSGSVYSKWKNITRKLAEIEIMEIFKMKNSLKNERKRVIKKRLQMKNVWKIWPQNRMKKNEKDGYEQNDCVRTSWRKLPSWKNPRRLFLSWKWNERHIDILWDDTRQIKR